jgi:hypothetical protein
MHSVGGRAGRSHESLEYLPIWYVISEVDEFGADA